MTSPLSGGGPAITVRAGHPDFLDLPWTHSLTTWDDPRIVDLPKGISRHEVRFVAYPEGIYAIKELPTAPARNDYHVLRALEQVQAPAVSAVGLVDQRHPDPGAEQSAALITRYVDFSFSYRELLEGQGFGPRRRQMLAAFAGLLVELHLAGCFWGDCSLSNVLYRYDAMAIEAIMVDAETASIHQQLSDGQRAEDLAIMEHNVLGGMCDIAASRGLDLDEADTGLGEEMARWYEQLWHETTRELVIPANERFRIVDHVRRLNGLGFTVDGVDLATTPEGTTLRVRPIVADRNFNATRLRELAGLHASEWQARHLLADLYRHAADRSLVDDSELVLAAAQWRAEVVNPSLARITEVAPEAHPIQGYCDFLNHWLAACTHQGTDADRGRSFEEWLAAGRPGFDPESHEVTEPAPDDLDPPQPPARPA